MAHLRSAAGRLLPPDENKVFEDKRTDLLATLLSRIARHLRYPMGEIDLKRGGYAPIGWQVAEQRTEALQIAALNMLQGRTVLLVRDDPAQAQGD